MKKTLYFFICCFLWTISFSFARAENPILEELTSPDIFFESDTILGESLIDFETVRSTGRDAFEKGVLKLPFGTSPTLNRVCFDAPLKLDATVSSTFYLDFYAESPDLLGNINFYFASGDGWYSMSPRIEKKSANELRCVFSPSTARIEGTPGGLKEVKSVRIAFYAGKPVDTFVKFHSFRARKNDLLLLIQNDPKAEDSSTYARQFSALLSQLGLNPGTILESDLTAEKLAQYPVFVLPIVHGLQPRTIKLLTEYAENGGFLIIGYGAPSQLLEKLGFRQTGYVRCSDAGLKLRGILLENDFRQQLGISAPESMAQASWNFVIGEVLRNPADPDLQKPENAPRIIGWWQNEDGQKTEYPALLWSSRGLWITHIFSSEGGKEKQAFLAALLNRKAPHFLSFQLREKWRSLLKIGVSPWDNANEKHLAAAKLALKELETAGFSPETVSEMIQLGSASSEGFRLSQKLDQMIHESREAFCQSQKAVPNERRFIWEHSGFGTYRGDWDSTMKELADTGFSGIISNFCWGGLAHYESEVLPVSEKAKEYGDQILQAVEAGKKYGVEVHVWKVNFNCSNSSKEFIQKMRGEGRLQCARDGAEESWLCPSHPENQALEVESFCEIVRKYDVKGIHFDYIRFPSASCCFCDGCRDRFGSFYRQKTGQELTNWPNCTWQPNIQKLWQEWRREQIAAVVSKTHDAVKKIKPAIEVSAAVFRDYPNCANSVGQDWVQWAKNGWLDFVCPMNYTNRAEHFKQMTVSQKEALNGLIPMFPGIGICSSSSTLSPDQCVIQIQTARALGMPGWTIFALTPHSAKKHFQYLKAGVTQK
ncbi:MAG: family 10 glycosylhydrolase [Thermoguttaceae bacterium]|nr:family 10 glycosylhydrolase [Thermoguttaceae bacterium]